MYSTVRAGVCSLIIALLLPTLLCAREARRGVPVPAHQEQAKPPLDLPGIIAALIKKIPMERLIQEVQERGVSFRLAPADEQEILRFGKDLDEWWLGQLMLNLRVHYRPKEVREEFVLRRDVPHDIEHLGFKASYAGQEDGGYHLIRVEGMERLELNTRAGCRYDIEWGSRQLTLTIIEASPEEVKAVLASKVEPPKLDLARVALPPDLKVHVGGNTYVSVQLVVGNHTKSALSLDPYYISEPLKVEVLRAYAVKTKTQKTRLPGDAKDTDLITEIHYQDARGIARMLRADLPSVEQWVNAYHAGFVKLTSRTEIVAYDGCALYSVREAGGSPANTGLSPDIFMQPELAAQVKGHVRLVIRPNPWRLITPKSDKLSPPPPGPRRRFQRPSRKSRASGRGSATDGRAQTRPRQGRG